MQNLDLEGHPVSPCPVSGGTDLQAVFTLGNMPVLCNQLWPDAQAAAAAPSGHIRLVQSRDCAMIWNDQFEPARMVYAPGYENALHFSPHFQAFAEELAAGLIARHQLAGRHIVEIGCGDGHMLDLMVAHGAATATGFDPSMAGVPSPFTAREGVSIVPEYFRAGQLERPFDAILCRHVLEHLDAPMPFLHDIRRAIGDRDDVVVYVEVPNAGWMLDAVSMWDVIYEHFGYWTAPALTTAFRRAGFAPISVTTGYDDQFLMIEARPSTPDPSYIAPGTEAVAASAGAFGTQSQAVLETWRTRLQGFEGRAVIWGAGSKGITFANALGAAAAPIVAMVDLNPKKHGLYAPGVARPVISAQDVQALAPELVLIANGTYEAEISAQVRAMGLDPEFAVIAS